MDSSGKVFTSWETLQKIAKPVTQKVLQKVIVKSGIVEDIAKKINEDVLRAWKPKKKR